MAKVPTAPEILPTLMVSMADVGILTGLQDYFDAAHRMWHDAVTRKMYITGGCGALYDGASPDGSKDQRSITRVHQAFGRN